MSHITGVLFGGNMKSEKCKLTIDFLVWFDGKLPKNWSLPNFRKEGLQNNGIWYSTKVFHFNFLVNPFQTT